MDRQERFAYRLITVNNKINDLLSYELNFSKLENPTLLDKEHMCVKIKFVYEYCWKTMKDYLKFKGKTKLLPRKVIEAMSEYFDISLIVEKSLISLTNTVVFTTLSKQLPPSIKTLLKLLIA